MMKSAMPEAVEEIWNGVTSDDYHTVETLKQGSITIDCIDDCIFCQADICTQIALIVDADTNIVVHGIMKH